MKIAKIIIHNFGPLDYLIPCDLDFVVGDLVLVPFRSKKVLGVIWELENETHIAEEKLKYIEQKLHLTLPKTCLDLMKWTSDYYLFSLGHIFKMIVPSQISSYLIKNKTPVILKNSKNEQSITNEYTQPNFNSQQIEAIEKINNLISSKKNNIIIDGVTGSGKTEIYLAVINSIISAKHSQALILLPEISLTNQIIDRITKRFGYAPCIWHSGMTPKQKLITFFKIIDGSAKIVIGARSSLFLPFKNLSTIVVDEEHEQSYKQEDGVNYHARDMAIIRAKLGNIPIILASASPSLETIRNVDLEKLQLVELSDRYNHNPMPNIHILDMKKEKHKSYFIAPKLIEELKANINNNQQSLLFLNRKGYAPTVICKQCGYQKLCNHCSTGMVYHKAQKKLKCHQCGFVAAIPKACPNCDSKESFIPCGPGVERLGEEIQELIPQAKIIILTQETFYNPKQSEKILNSIINKEYNIIIGTQIIAKGHHFPALTLVGIIDADSGMSGGDLRANEKTYQLLQQVGGRAGREIDNSKIFIQTYNPEHPLILALKDYNRKKFVQEEMNIRKSLQMPPFGRLAAIILSSKQEQKLIEFSKNLVKLAPIAPVVKVLGPAPAIIYKIRSKFRYRILIKTTRNINIQAFIKQWLDKLTIPSNIHLKIDIDPYYFL